MKKYILLCLVFSFIANAAPLAGDYYINQNGTEDYSSISAAVADLNSEGISAPVIFNIRTGVYDEQVTINAITRTGAIDDRVAFKRASPGDVVEWKNTSQTLGSNWIVHINGADDLSLVNIEFQATNSNYQRMVFVENNSDGLIFSGNVFSGMQATLDNEEASLIYMHDTDFFDSSSDVLIDNNTFTYGYHGYFQDMEKTANVTISNNQFSLQKAGGIMDLEIHEDKVIDNNIFDSPLISLSSYRAIYASGTIKNNTINIISNGSGIKTFGSDVFVTQVYNNMVSLNNPSAGGPAIHSQGYTDIYHNSLRVASAGSGISVNTPDPSYRVQIISNIISCDGGGLALNVYGEDSHMSIVGLGGNNYYSTGSTLIHWYQGPDIGAPDPDFTDLASFQAEVTAHHPNVGISKAVDFIGTVGINYDLHLSGASDGDLDLIIVPSTIALDDIDGDVRGLTNTYMGADEATPITPLDDADTVSGFYTIGGTSPDYSTVTEAVDDLVLKGTKGEVTFKIRAGTYSVHSNLKNLIKTNASDLITFMAANINAKPLLQNIASNSDENYIFKLQSNSFIKFLNLNFSVGSSGGYGRIFEFAVDVDDITIESCSLQGLQTGAVDNNSALIYSQSTGNTNGLLERISLLNNTFSDGSFGFYADHDTGSTNEYSDIEITGNTFNYSTIESIFISKTDYFNISSNTINSSGSDITGVHIFIHNDASLIENNKININGSGGVGIYLESANGAAQNDRAIMQNNFIRARTALKFTGNRFWNVYHNTLVAADFGLWMGESPTNNNAVTDIRYINNIIQMHTDGIPLSVNHSFSEPMSVTLELDYNNYYQATAGTLIQWYGTDYSNGVAYSTATSQDTHSVGKAVEFIDSNNGDLHLTGASVGDLDISGNGIGVTLDIDGDTRAVISPYMGADEANAALVVPKVKVTLLDSGFNGSTGESSATTADFEVVLETQPTDDVIINISSNDVSEGTILPNQMTFTSSDWGSPQSLSVSGVDDLIQDGAVYYQIEFNAASNDGDYDGIFIESQTVVNFDDDIQSNLILSRINDAQEPSTNGNFRISYDSGLSNAEDVLVTYVVTGTASLGTDYSAITGTKTLPALSNSVDINIDVIDDNLIEPLEIVTMELTGKNGGIGTINVNTTPANLSIQDDEEASVFVYVQHYVYEPDTNGFFRIRLDGGVSETDTEIDVSFAGVATQGVDYQNMPTSVTIPALSIDVDIPITVIDDIDSESDEEITISLDSVNNPLISISSMTPLVSKIFDNDTDADIEVTISAINPTLAVGDMFDFNVNLINHDAINVHQAVLQVLEPAGLSFVDWQCQTTVEYCTQTQGSDDVSDVISIAANSEIQFIVYALVTGSIEDSINIQAILNPAPFLNDTDTNNNSTSATSLIDVYFKNGFETNSNQRLYQLLTDFDLNQKNINSTYYFIEDKTDFYQFIQINKENNTINYRYINIDIFNEQINTSHWISNEK